MHHNKLFWLYCCRISALFLNYYYLHLMVIFTTQCYPSAAYAVVLGLNVLLAFCLQTINVKAMKGTHSNTGIASCFIHKRNEL